MIGLFSHEFRCSLTCLRRYLIVKMQKKKKYLVLFQNGHGAFNVSMELQLLWCFHNTITAAVFQILFLLSLFVCKTKS